ncbi:hypothetical protein H0H81_011391, partial [Sphagnurus paluster]
DRMDEFMRTICQWRNLKMLKRTGCGHDPLGIENTKPGECAIKCPACPRPGINLLLNWEVAPEDKRYLYALFVGIDANFHLKRKIFSSEARDPSLAGRCAFFVEEAAYKKYLVKCWDNKQEKSHCVSHNVVNKPDQEARSLAASGAGTIDCSRHDFKRPLGVRDLQRGERYLNMDYMFLSSVRNSGVHMIVVSYDIICQWCLNMHQQMLSYPHHLQWQGGVLSMIFLVPKFHLPAHIEACNLLYSFNLTPGVGRTDGEAPERGWANINLVAQSTKEMGPGSHRDTLDDHFNNWNWKKITRFGPLMLKKLREAVAACKEHRDALKDFEASIPLAVIKAWRDTVEKWEKDEKCTNPYKSTVKDTFLFIYSNLNVKYHLVIPQKAARLQLAQEVEAMAGQASDDFDEDRIYLSVMIANGLVLENDQVKANTRSNVAIETATQTIEHAAARYQTCQAALVVLSRGRATPTWEATLWILLREDIQALLEGLHSDSEGRKIPSWIWTAVGVADLKNNVNPALDDTIQIEWCKSRARKMRWEEEVELLCEEMCCIVVTLDWQAQWWIEQAASMVGLGLPKQQEGMVAYVHSQASTQLALCTHLQKQWIVVPSIIEAGEKED